MDRRQLIAHRTAGLLYWAAVATTCSIGLFVVIPFYVYGIPVNGAGARADYDVSLYWPFAYSGPGQTIHDACIALAILAPLVVPSCFIWSVLRYLGEGVRNLWMLVPGAASLIVGVLYALNWRAILAWHLD
jgi:hypothetical protein